MVASRGQSRGRLPRRRRARHGGNDRLRGEEPRARVRRRHRDGDGLSPAEEIPRSGGSSPATKHALCPNMKKITLEKVAQIARVARARDRRRAGESPTAPGGRSARCSRSREPGAAGQAKMAAMPREKRLFGALFLRPDRAPPRARPLGPALSLHRSPRSSRRRDDRRATPASRRTAFAEFYRVDTFLKPNTFHLRSSAASRSFPRSESANRVSLRSTSCSFPLSVLLVFRKLGGIPWFSLLSFLLLYNYNASWGFVGFVFAIPLVLLFCHFFVFDERGVVGRRASSGPPPFLVLLYFVHLLAALFCCSLLLFLRLAARRRRTLRALPASLAARSRSSSSLLAWWRGEGRDYAGPGLSQFLSDYYSRRLRRRRSFTRKSDPPLRQLSSLRGRQGIRRSPALFSLGVVVPAIVLSARARGRTRARRAFFPFSSGRFSAVCFCPTRSRSSRCSTSASRSFLLLALIVYGGPARRRGCPAPPSPAFVALGILHYALWASYFFDFNRENAGFDRAFLRPAGSGKKLAGLVVRLHVSRERRSTSISPATTSSGRKAPATASIADYRFGPVRRAPSASSSPAISSGSGSAKLRRQVPRHGLSSDQGRERPRGIRAREDRRRMVAVREDRARALGGGESRAAPSPAPAKTIDNRARFA